MTFVALVLVVLGQVLIVWGISRKATVQSWLRSVGRSLQLVADRTVRGLRLAWTGVKHRWGQFKNWLWNGFQRVRERFGLPKHIRVQIHESIGITTSVGDSLVRAEPTPTANQRRIDAMEQRLDSADREALFADGLVVVGGTLSVIGAILLAIT